MKRILHFTIGAAYAAVGVAFATVCEAQGVGGIAQVAIIDRDSGAVLSPYFYHGEYWVAGTPGARYAIEIRNRLTERVLAVTSVDGVNVVTGATAGWDQAGYVFGPGERYQITGWRKSDAQVAAFTFTDLPNSYAGRTGRPANIGVIGVAVFRERPPQPAYSPPSISQSAPEASAPAQDANAARDSNAARDANAARESDSAAAGGARSKVEPSVSPPPSAQLQAPAPAPKLGTGHGEREFSYASRTEFSRLQTQPNEIIRIHYDSLDNLFALGIVKRPRPLPAQVNPFPASPAQHYVPDPPG
jgi:hypothetical protein